MKRGYARDERGAVIIIMAAFIVVLFIVVAIVIDLGATRSDRRGGQVAVDNAAASAAQTLLEEDAVEACIDAIAILNNSLRGASFSSSGCSQFSSACSNVTANPLPPQTSGEYTLVIHHPVLDTSPLMNRASVINGSPVASSSDDGEPCDRIGVQLTTTGSALFGDIAGADQRVSSVHSVGRITEGTTVFRPLNLLALDRTACPTLNISGNGEVVVAAPRDSLGNYLRGTAATDSDGSKSGGLNNCGGNTSTIEANGTNARLTANGPCDGAPMEKCPGTGQILAFAAFGGSGSCAGIGDVHACRETGRNARIDPDVGHLTERFTRAPLDYRYNCKASYVTELWYLAPLFQDIPGCPTETSDTDYVDELRAFVLGATAPSGTPAWTTIQTPSSGAGPRPPDPCSPTDGTVFSGNIFVNCATFTPSGTVTFSDGNVIFAGLVRLTGGATLNLHSCAVGCTDSLDWSPGDNYDENQSSPNAAWVYFKQPMRMNSGNLNVNKASLFFGVNSQFDMTGGNVNWTAPNSTPADETPFDDLAMWSDGSETHSLNGNGSINLVGVFFNGRSTFSYSGDGMQTLDEAQFVANRLEFSGNGTITLSPDPNNSVAFPVAGTFGVIR